MSGQTLIAIAGRQGSGKTTMASTLVASGSVRLSIAAPIKRMVRDAYGDLEKWQTIHCGGDRAA
jgi:molybdopterin-guanine dinucleotide biosynthesis protein